MNVSREEANRDQVEQVMKICVFHVSEGHEGLLHVDVSIVIKGTEVLNSCPSVAKASLLLMGIIYALNLSYPPKLKYTFEVFQKLLLELDVLKLSLKVQSLRKTLQCN
ncbi:hypothetical protein CHARACLAT_030520 [Characodon lateralis]|uniref:Uncharacterized protein n=1 Tax=Characodon lateralis TaxID=208331 RepID=A0ABU7D3V2_9TELE|nr:hypothetical protein [Characodon lateralis]